MAESNAPPAPRDGGAAGAVDVEKLADRVYRLMMAEARLERTRGVESTLSTGAK